MKKWFIALILPFVVGYSLLVGIGFLLTNADTSQTADAIVMLSGEAYYRTELAASLYLDNAAPIILLTETYGAKSTNRLDFARGLLQELGVTPGSIKVATGNATSTYDEAREVLSYAETNPLKSVLIVTEPYHTFRAKLLFQKVLGEAGIKVRIARPLEHMYRPLTWMFHLDGWRATISEVFKLSAYLVGIKGG